MSFGDRGDAGVRKPGAGRRASRPIGNVVMSHEEADGKRGCYVSELSAMQWMPGIEAGDLVEMARVRLELTTNGL